MLSKNNPRLGCVEHTRCSPASGRLPEELASAARFTFDAPRAKVRGPANPEVGIGGGQTRIYLYDHPAGDNEVGEGAKELATDSRMNRY